MLTGVLLLGAVAVGATLGIAVPSSAGPAGDVTAPLILALVTVLLTGLRLGNLGALRRAPRTVAVALALNFLVIPVIAFAVSSVVMIDEEALRVGVLLYCLFPCTDWFLGFTRLADGDTVTGAALIPVNISIQLALYPVYLHLLTGEGSGPLGWADWSTLITWFAVPAGIALAVRASAAGVAYAVGRGAARRAAGWAVARLSDAVAPVVLLAMVVALFAANAETIADHPAPFAKVLAAVFLFLLTTFLVGEYVTNRLGMSHSEKALVVMTTSARNAPLILALTVVALPDEPMVHAAIVLGMLVEFPHLTALQQLLVRSRDRSSANTATNASSPPAEVVRGPVGSRKRSWPGAPAC